MSAIRRIVASSFAAVSVKTRKEVSKSVRDNLATNGAPLQALEGPFDITLVPDTVMTRKSMRPEPDSIVNISSTPDAMAR